MDTNTTSQIEDEDDDIPRLSAETMAALQEFYDEESARESLLSSVENNAGSSESSAATTPKTELLFEKDIGNIFPEDWQMSQFWYDDATSRKLVNILKRIGGDSESIKIACISCPSVYQAYGPSPNVHLFEYDKRFSTFGPTYIFYDYNYPETVPEEAINSYSIIIADPPFLAEECLSKVAQTVKKIAKLNAKIILCTGAVMENLASEILSLQKTSFTPLHKNNLGNDFACYANFPLDDVDDI